MPHIDMTVEMLREAGVTVHTPGESGDADTWKVLPGKIDPVDWVVEPDLSNATPFLAAAAVTGGTVRVPACGRRAPRSREMRSAESSRRWGPTSGSRRACSP